MVPLVFLAVSALLNVALDLLCVIVFGWGVKGAAGATVFSQFVFWHRDRHLYAEKVPGALPEAGRLPLG